MADPNQGKGPLAGVRVIEMAGIGPAPFGVGVLADAGADVIRIQGRQAAPLTGAMKAGHNPMTRGRRSLSLDLKRPGGVEALLRLVEGADVLIEGFRPGVMERLGVGPDVCLARKPALVYGRMTGWGQHGPLALAAGHDLNYIALSGALHAIGPADQPAVPLNLIGDFGGGGMLLAFGVASALLQAERTGRGQVVDAAMCDGAALLMSPLYGQFAAGNWRDSRQSNLLDGAAPHYGVYRCADGGFVAIGPLEPQFYDTFLKLLGLDDPLWRQRDDRARWPEMRQRLEAIFLARSRAQWCELLEGTDVCFAPVLSMAEAPHHPHNAARRTFVDTGGGMQPAPAPRFGDSANARPEPETTGAAVAEAVLREAGFSDAERAALARDGVLGTTVS